MQKHDVEIEKIDLQVGNELSDNFYRNCTFCDKLVKITPLNFQSCSRIGNTEYCPFCLRNNFNHKDNRNILVFSFRAIAGYYYYRLYKARHSTMFVSQIEAMLEKHAIIGLMSPVLAYDPYTLLWFANFNKIGKTAHKAPFEEVQHTIKKMYDVFEVAKILYPYAETNMWDKFDKATKLFHEQRKRPKGKKMLIPTFSQVTSNIPAENDEFHELTRDFNKTCLIVK